MKKTLREEQLEKRRAEILKPLAFNVNQLVPEPIDPEVGRSCGNYVGLICVVSDRAVAEQIAQKLRDNSTANQEEPINYVVQAILGVSSVEDALELTAIEAELDEITEQIIRDFTELY